jgi:hypothetical protein
MSDLKIGRRYGLFRRRQAAQLTSPAKHVCHAYLQLIKERFSKLSGGAIFSAKSIHRTDDQESNNPATRSAQIIFPCSFRWNRTEENRVDGDRNDFSFSFL